MYRNIIVIIFVTTLLHGCASSSYKRFYIYEKEFAINLPTFLSYPAPFAISIDRKFANSIEEQLLSKAESTLPVFYMEQLLEEPTRKKGQWWSDDFDGIRMAETITRSAVEYYLDLSRKFQQGDFSVTHGIKMLNSNFEYKATILPVKEAFKEGNFKKNIKEIFIVYLSLEWENYCGELCGMEFELNKIVFIDSQGKIIELYVNPFVKYIIY